MHKYEFYGTWDDCDFYWDSHVDFSNEELKRHTITPISSDTPADTPTDTPSYAPVKLSHTNPSKNTTFNTIYMNKQGTKKHKNYKK